MKIEFDLTEILTDEFGDNQTLAETIKNEVLVIGELDYNVWTDKSQVKHYDLSIKANEVILLPKQEKSNNQSQNDLPY